jgi:glutamate-1-semialdehyde 2,1-aminomutase
MSKFEKSAELFRRAMKTIPGGVNSPVRAFKSVGTTPLFLTRGKGSKVYDADGNEYIDYVCSWGPLILGYSHPAIVAAVRDEAEKATSFGASTELEIQLAEQIVKMVPSIEMVRLVNSGTEATMSAVRLARGFSGKNKIIKFTGCYHGHGDSFLIQAGSGATTLGVPNSPGVTDGTIADTLLAPYNDLQTVDSLVKQFAGQISAIIVEPVAGNMGVIPPQPGFLEGLRRICDENEVLLIFDEVITGFRLAPGGAQEFYGVVPDLTTLGKIIGGGLPVGAYGGREEIMEQVAPVGAVYQAGTLSGNPLAVRAGLETLRILDSGRIYGELEEKAQRLESGIRENIKRLDLPLFTTRVGSMSCMFFTKGPVTDYASATKSDTERFAVYFRAMLERGIYLAPSQFEASFVSATHSEEDLSKTIEANFEALKVAIL